MPKALLFDYGNTLIAFGPEQQRAQLEAMTRVLTEAGIEVDLDRLDALRREQVMRPYHSGGVENVWEEVCREVAALFTEDADDELTRQISQARQQAFWSSTHLPPETAAMLKRLRSHFRLGLLSNYPCTDSIRESLRQQEILGLFETVVVSADVGFAKPHAKPYEALLSKMNLQPGEAVYVGDNWLADIQGAGRLGLRTIWVREHIPYETFEPEEGDLPATGEIDQILDLEALLSDWMNETT
jgi:HAD superfamily hydrolase (TIGR01549 family)